MNLIENLIEKEAFTRALFLINEFKFLFQVNLFNKKYNCAVEYSSHYFNKQMNKLGHKIIKDHDELQMYSKHNSQILICGKNWN